MNEVTKVQPAPAPAMALGETLFKLLADPNIPAEKMQILLQMQREIMADSRRERFQTAFAALAKELPQVERKGKVELIKEKQLLGKYSYAKWEDMDKVLRPIWTKHGFGISFSGRVTDSGKQVLIGKLMHEAGHFETSERLLIADPGPGRNNLQAEGSGLSYAKRYIAEGLLNIVRRDEDDDGIAGGLKTISNSQVKELTKLLDETKTKADTFLRLFLTDIESMSLIPEREFPRLKNALEEKKHSMNSKKGGTK